MGLILRRYYVIRTWLLPCIIFIVLAYNVSFAATLTLHPSGADPGDTASYTGGTAATALDSNDGNTSYGSSSDDDDDFYLEIDDVAAFGSINSVQVFTVARMGMSIVFTIGVKTNGSSYFSGSLSGTSSYLTYNGNLYTTNPQSGSAWTWSEVNNLVAIVNLTNGSGMMRVTELYVVVDYNDLSIVKQVWEENGSVPLLSPVSAPVGSTLVFLIYVKNTDASSATDARVVDNLDESGFQYVSGSLVRTNSALPPPDTATDKQIFDATAPGTGTVLSDAVDGDVSSAQDTGGLSDPDRITMGAVTGQANGTLTINGNTTFALRFKAIVK